MSREPRVVRWFVLFLLTTHVLILATGCGFTPLYGKHGGAGYGNEDLFQLVSIDGIAGREGQYLRNALIDRFYREGRPASPQYALAITDLDMRRTDLDLTQSASSTREQMRITAGLLLRDKITGQTLLERRLSATASYNVLESEFATRISREEGKNNALLTLASQIEAQLGLYFQRAEKPAPTQ